MMKRRYRTRDFELAPDINAAIEDIVAGLGKVVSLRRAAEALGISHHTLRRWIRERRIAALKSAPGAAGRIRVPRTEIARILRAQATC